MRIRPIGAGATLAVAWLASAPAVALAQEPRFKETVQVERVLVDARVVDGRGQPIRGLAARDFRVEVDGTPARVESAHWVSADEPYPEGLEPEAAAAAGAPKPAPGRLIVFFFQKSLDSSRVGGLIKMQRRAAQLLDTLGDEDRVAVVSFDSHLKLWVDFTSQRPPLRRAIEHSVLHQDRPQPIRAFYFPSLAEHFDAAAAQQAATPEKGLEVLARALEPLPGPKTLVFLGWGLGEMQGRLGVRMIDDYEPARQALLESRTSVFALDVTDADWHSLEVGLQQAAQDTGGFYAKTHLFDQAAFTRLRGALAGHYVLAVEKPAVQKPGSHRLSVKLLGRQGTVLTKASYQD